MPGNILCKKYLRTLKSLWIHQFSVQKLVCSKVNDDRLEATRFRKKPALGTRYLVPSKTFEFNAW